MIGQFVDYLPGNVQDLSLPGVRAAFAASPGPQSDYQDWKFIESIGQETGRFDMNGALPGRYYGLPWLAPNSGVTFGVGSSVYSDVGTVGAGSPLIGAASSIGPAPSLPAAQVTGQPVGPVTLTTPMPSVLQPRRDQVTASQLQPCALAQWVNKNPLLAVGGALALYFVLRGGK